MPSTPLLVVGTYREPGGSRAAPLAELLGDLRREPGVERVTLAGLGEREAQTLLETSAGHDLDVHGTELARELHRETAGNPFFLGEMVRHLVESGAIQRSGDGIWTEATVLSTLELPASVHEVISGRVARLGPDAERVLRTAAVIGREFDVHLLARVSGIGEDDAIDILEAAAAAALVAEAGDRPGRFTFVHALVNHALGDELTARAPRPAARAHRAGARGASRRRPRTRALGELAQHWAAVAEPGAQAKARDYATRAGRAALSQLAPDEAVRWFEQALELGRSSARDRCGESARACCSRSARLSCRPASPSSARPCSTSPAPPRQPATVTNSCAPPWPTAAGTSARRASSMSSGWRCSRPRSSMRRRLIRAARACGRSWPPSCSGPGDHRRRRALSDEAVELARRDDDVAALAYVLMLRVTAVWWPETLPRAPRHHRRAGGASPSPGTIRSSSSGRSSGAA